MALESDPLMSGASVTATTEKRAWYRENFDLFERGLSKSEPEALRSVRKAAIGRLSQTGFPTTRNEDWKYTSVTPIMQGSFAHVVDPGLGTLARADIDPLTFGTPGWSRLVFVDGRYAPAFSSPGRLNAGVKVASLAETIEREFGAIEQYLALGTNHRGDAFSLLNTAFIRDGAFVYVPRGVALESPVHLLFITTARDDAPVTHPRVVIVLEPKSRATIIESYVGQAGAVYFTNAVTEIVAGDDSVVEHYRIQEESPAAFHIGAVEARVGRNGRFTSGVMSFGGALVRNNIGSTLDGEGGECALNGLFYTSGKQHVDSHTTIDHVAPHCMSRELYKGILDGRSRGVFNGKIIVRPDAQQTDARQTNRNLLLAEEATIDTKPQLEILANDVKCSHGATVGRLDQESLFYMRSRGIGEERARAILTYAFAAEVVELISVPPLRAYLDAVLLGKTAHGGAR